MKLRFSPGFAKALKATPVSIQKAVAKQSNFLVHNFKHPSLRAKKYNKALDIWQARVTKDWRFYFKIAGDTYILIDISRHPK